MKNGVLVSLYLSLIVAPACAEREYVRRDISRPRSPASPMFPIWNQPARPIMVHLYQPPNNINTGSRAEWLQENNELVLRAKSPHMVRNRGYNGAGADIERCRLPLEFDLDGEVIFISPSFDGARGQVNVFRQRIATTQPGYHHVRIDALRAAQGDTGQARINPDAYLLGTGKMKNFVVRGQPVHQSMQVVIQMSGGVTFGNGYVQGPDILVPAAPVPQSTN